MSDDVGGSYPGNNEPESGSGAADHSRFPRIVADTLSGRTLVLPDSLDSGLAVVALVFRRHAQPVVDSWLGPLARRLGGHRSVGLYEIPMLAGGWRMMSGFIDSGMRSGIPPHKHHMVATCYGDLSRVRSALDIHDLDSVYVYLIDGSGSVHWRADGWAVPRRIEDLMNVVNRHTDMT